MGFQLPPRTRRIRFEPGSDYDGLEIEAAGITVHEWLTATLDTVEHFLSRVESWNWETPDGVEIVPVLPPVRDRGDTDEVWAERLAAHETMLAGRVDAGVLDRQDLRNVAGWWVKEVTDIRPFALRGTTSRAQVNHEIEQGLPTEALNGH